MKERREDRLLIWREENKRVDPALFFRVRDAVDQRHLSDPQVGIPTHREACYYAHACAAARTSTRLCLSDEITIRRLR
jgi:hypothetical protein